MAPQKALCTYVATNAPSRSVLPKIRDRGARLVEKITLALARMAMPEACNVDARVCSLLPIVLGHGGGGSRKYDFTVDVFDLVRHCACRSTSIMVIEAMSKNMEHWWTTE